MVLAAGLPHHALCGARVCCALGRRGAAHDAPDGRGLGAVLLEEFGPEFLAQIGQRRGHEFQDVAVGIDHRMVELLAHLLGR